MGFFELILGLNHTYHFVSIDRGEEEALLTHRPCFAGDCPNPFLSRGMEAVWPKPLFGFGLRQPGPRLPRALLNYAFFF